MGCQKPGSINDRIELSLDLDDRDPMVPYSHAEAEYLREAYNVELEHPNDVENWKNGKGFMCHSYARHDAGHSKEYLENRVNDKVRYINYATKFHTLEIHKQCREIFLELNKSDMNEALRQGESTFVNTVFSDQSIGEGIERNSPNDINAIHAYTFKYDYIDGKWYEITGYPDADKDPNI